jgi:hypothetical protein
MLPVAGKPSAAENSPSRPLPLESGEFMHSREFLRRYEYMPQVKKAELIEGVVYMGSPVSVHQACCTAASSLASNCPLRHCWPATPPKSWRH